MKRIIGITGPSNFSPKVQKMVERHFNAIPLTINQNDPDDLQYVLEQVDGIILSGGVDVCPTTFGREICNREDLTNFDIDRDKREIFIYNWAIKAKIPMFGICRGHQILGLIHNLPFDLNINNSIISHNPTTKGINVGDSPAHFVYVGKKDSKEFFETEFVNSFHHQAIVNEQEFDYDEKGVDILGIARTDFEGGTIVELMRAKDKSWLSCQWHPENDYESNKASTIVIDAFKKMLK